VKRNLNNWMIRNFKHLILLCEMLNRDDFYWRAIDRFKLTPDEAEMVRNTFYQENGRLLTVCLRWQ